MKKHTLFMFIAFITGIMSCSSPTRPAASVALAEPAEPAGRYYVKISGSDANDGASWENAFQTLQKAIESAGPGYEIWVAAGMYRPTRNAADKSTGDERDNAFVLKDSVAIYGGFPAEGNPTMSDRNWETYVSAMSGDIGVTGNPDDNCYHVVISVGVSDRTLLDGFTITGGNASFDEGMPDEGEDEDDLGRITVSGQPVSGECGGGMYNRTSSPTLKNIIFRDSMASLHAGGIYNTRESSPALNHVSITGNSAGYGGGMSNKSESTPVLTHVTVSENKADMGGGIYNDYSSPILNQVIINKNVAEGRGGGIGGFGSHPFLTNVTVSENIAGKGGGFDIQNSYPVLVNVMIIGNKAKGNGGGLACLHSGPVLVNVLVSGNRAEEKGGGIYIWSSSATLINATVSGNMARDGGGVFAYENNFTFPVLYNSIVFGNSSGMLQKESKFPANFFHCLVQEMSAEELNEFGLGNLNANTVKGAIFADPVNPAEAPATGGDYRLAKGSAMINKGNSECWNVAQGYFQDPPNYSYWEYPRGNLGYKTVSALNEKTLIEIFTDNGVSITDLDGKKRILGTVDVGAYEYKK